ncbi:hypothetical protein KY290_036672 [Solanum tuberosum]|uniref:Uncharacterized protein n=1 Tax=Solanum tuberosum TaxID=4113 RepID=A0ABQ7TTC6_SOLTU|nr:hypothetical protein KY289_036161 [Solanum tuberosum]KAH0639402.1 hypothetical protein KY285_035988 [Solanum tuberosum]KAH0737967.1 hypothetical protein KY290_036672 [Solanum tuberosum]
MRMMMKEIRFVRQLLPLRLLIRASVAHRDSSSLSYFPQPASLSSAGPGGFWGVLVSKAKAILEEDDQQFQSPTNQNQFYHNHNVVSTKMNNPILRKRLHALTSSLNHIGDAIGNALEEGRTIVEYKTADIIQETQTAHHEKISQRQQSSTQTNHEDQLKASRDVAMATAAKGKLLLREVKTVKADVAFAKLRCCQLEEENKILRESCEKGDNPADDDMIRLQLETLLAEKGRLAHENSVYACENRFLREIVEYHQLTMQDHVVYLDEGIEQVSRMHSTSPPTPH